MRDETAENPFKTYWDRGFRRLVPVVPPKAPLSEHSSIYRRMHADPKDDARGKVPGVRREDGLWTGIQFVGMEAQERDLAVWHEMGASVGIKTGQGLLALDIDTLHSKTASVIYKAAGEFLGAAPLRFGNLPKCLMLYLGPEDTPYQVVQFSTPTEDKARVELLTEGRQFVAHGIHPKTGQPYRWHGDRLPRYDDLIHVSAEQLAAFFRHLAETLPNAKGSTSSSDREAPDPETLRAPSWDALKATVDAIPNVSAWFPSRQDMLRVGYAIKAAAPAGYEHEALDLFLTWADRWLDPGEGQDANDPDYVIDNWNRMKPPFRTGYSFLKEHAVGLIFDQLPMSGMETDTDDLFAERSDGTRASGYRLLSIDDVLELEPPRFLVDRHLPEAGFGILYGDPGSFKSFLALDLALHLSHGVADWHGDPLTLADGAPARVLYIAGEGAAGFKARIGAWRAAHPEAATLASGAGAAFRFVFQPVNFMRADDIGKLVEAVRGAGYGQLSLIVVDTVSRSIPGADENTQKDMTIFVAACDALRHATGAFVLGVHHTAKAGQMRGSSVFLGQADAVFRVDRKKGTGIVRMTCEKQKDAPDGWHETYSLDRTVSVDGGESLVPRRLDAGSDEAREAICTADMQQDILEAMQEAWDAGGPWGIAPQSKDRYAPRLIASRWSVPAEAAEAWLDLWEKANLCERAVFSRVTKKKGWRTVQVSDDEDTPLS